MSTPPSAIPAIPVASRVFVIRGAPAMLDAHLAAIYNVTPADLNRTVARDARRFPGDFRFQLTREEYEALEVQLAPSHHTPAGQEPPCMFTDAGVAMLSCVLRSERAADVSLTVMRAFVRLRHVLATDADIAGTLAGRDPQIPALFAHIAELLRPPPSLRYPVSNIMPARPEP